MRKGTPYGKMSTSDRRRSSKWDLKEESRIAYENIHDSGKSGLSFHDRDSRDWLSPEAPIGNHSKWSVPESLPGRRGSRRDGSIDEDRNRSLKGMATWEVEESYGTRMSPGLEDWRQQSHHKSPKNEWKRSRRSRSQSQSRSRSRSPIRDFGRESGMYERSRSRSGASAQVCKDYAASGWCRRGNHCHFLHGQTYEDSWERQRKSTTPKYSMPHDSREYPTGSGKSTDCCTEFLKGSCRRGSSCRFSHHGASHGKVSSNEVTRERNNDRRQRDSSLERHNDREPRRAAAIPCKFFAAGNCRNGKYCRFAHQDQTYPSPDRSRDGRISLDHHSADGGKLWTKWSTTSDGGNFSEDKDEIIVIANQRETVRSVDNKWGHRLEEDKKLSDSLTDDWMVESEKKEVLPWKNENADDSKLTSEQRVSENWVGDMDMSPEWTYKVQPSKPIDKQVPLTNYNPNVIKQATVQMHNSIEVMPSERNESYAKPPDLNLVEAGVSALLHDGRSMAGAPGSHGIILSDMRSGHSFNQNGLSSNALPLTGSSAVGQGRIAFPNSGGIINPPIQMAVQVGKAINKPDIVEPIASQLNSGVAITQNNVSSEQLSTISASLAQLLANAACGSLAHNMAKTSVFDNEGPIKMDSAVNLQSNETMRVQNHQYNPIFDSIEAEKHEVSNNPPGFFPTPNMQINIANEKQEITLNNKTSSSAVAATESSDKNMISGSEEAKDKSCQVIQLEPGGNSSVVAKENNGPVTEESTKVEENKDAQENGPLENTDGDEKNDDGKKGKDKDSKNLRAFKFALVEFAKELLKPAWKEGQMSKDAYKNIVKKVVEKVTGTMKEANVPQTQEKIQQYLSFSKPKLTKLVQAYVEKFQKDK